MRFTEQIMRPPQEAHSLLLRATQGCTYNDCHFCYVSRNHPFLAATPAEFEGWVRAAAPTFRPGTPVYLVGSNPFALPADRLCDYLDILHRHLGEPGEVSLQARIDDITPKDDGELRLLKERGLAHLYLGVENGHDTALALMNKGYTAEDVVTQLGRLDRAGIAYTTYYVIGLGGRGMGRACGMATAAMFNRVHPRRITSTGMTIFAGTPLADMVRTGRFVEATEREKIEELLAFLENLDIDTFYDGIHYLNALNYRLDNRDAERKKAVLDDIREVLATWSDEEMELMANRKALFSL